MAANVQARTSGRKRVRRRRNRRVRNDERRLQSDIRDVEDLPQRRRRRDRRENEELAEGKFGPLSELFGELDEELVAYCDAVIHPFSDDAIGATRPDNWNTISLPCTDRLTIDFDPGLFLNASPGMQTISGYVFWLQPRCVSAGWGREISGEPVIPIASMNPDFSQYSGEPFLEIGSDVAWGNLYSLMFGVIGTSGASNGEEKVHGYNPGTQSMFVGQLALAQGAPAGLNAIAFSRFAKIRSNVDGARIIGMGLKAWSQAPPLTTGGTAYGGWLTSLDAFQALGAMNPLSPGQGDIQDLLQHRQHFQGVKGVTVRYSTIQDAEQQQYVVPYISGLHYASFAPATQQLPVVIDENVEVSPAEACKQGDYLPCVVWKFNSNAAEDLYTVRVECRVHLQGRPTGDNPFATIAPKVEPLLPAIETLLSNPGLFPAAVGGHSFEGFVQQMTTIGREMGERTVEFGKGAMDTAMTIQRFIADHPELLQAGMTVGTMLL